MHRAFCNESYSIGKKISIEESEAHHILKVLRLLEGEKVELFDGKGNIALAVILETSKKSCTVEISEIKNFPNGNSVSVVFSIPKGQALDFIIHRCTELGVKEFIPVLSEHSLHPKSWNTERWEKVLIEVCKQCQATYLPVLHEPTPLKEWAQKRDTQKLLLFCDEAKRDEKPPFVKNGQEIELMIGAEGGWSEGERAQILNVGAHLLSLGHQRLRAETASIVGLTLAKKLLGEL